MTVVSMHRILSFWRDTACNCFGFSSAGYTRVKKKDDDASLGALKVCQAWKDRFPVGKNFQELGVKNENEYCKALLLGLKAVPYNDDSSPVILDHVKAIASQSYLMHRALFDTLSSSSVKSLDRKMLSDMGFTLLRIAPQT